MIVTVQTLRIKCDSEGCEKYVSGETSDEIYARAYEYNWMRIGPYDYCRDHRVAAVRESYGIEENK